MAKKLINLSVNEISLVDQGANPNAHVKFFKNRTKGSDMTIEELRKKLEETEGSLAVYKALSEMNDQEKEFHKSLGEGEAKDFLKMSADARKTKMGDKVVKMVKSSELEAVQKKLTDAEAEVTKAKDEAKKKDDEIAKLKASGEEKDLITEVNKRFPLTAGTPEEKAKVLKTIKSMPEAEQKVVLKAMEDAEARLADLAKEKGSTTGGADAKEPKEKLDALAKKLQSESNGAMTFEQAFSKALDTDEGRKLNQEIRSA